MANQRVDIVVAAKDQASRKLLGITRAAIGMGAAFFSWRAIKAIVTDVTGAYGVQERADRKLEQSLKATGYAAGFTYGQLKDYAAQLQLLTDYGDENIETMMSLLNTFKNVQGPVYTDATKIILDMSYAMDQGLKETSIQVGKALNDPIQGVTALRRVGVQLSDQQEAQIRQFMKVNDIASAQRIILAELTSQFGGQAAAAANTFGGKLKQLANDFGDTKEQMGGMIAQIPGMGTGINFLRTIFRNFGLSMNIAWTWSALKMVQFWEDLKFTFTTAIPNVFQWFLGNWKEIFQTIWSFQKNWTLNMFENLKNFFIAVWSWLKGDGFDFKWTSLLDGFESTIKEFPDIVREGRSEVEKALEEELRNLKGQFNQKYQEVVNPTLTAPTPGSQGGQTPDLAAAAKASKGVAAVEARFLAGGTQTADYQKETAQQTRRATTLLERIVKAVERQDFGRVQRLNESYAHLTNFR